MIDLPLTPQLQSVLSNSKKLALDLHRNGVDIDIFFQCFLENLSLSCENILIKCDILDELISNSYSVIEKKKPSKNASSNIKKDVYTLLQNCESSQKTLFYQDYISGEIILLNLLNENLTPKAFKKILDANPELISEIIKEITFFCADVNFDINNDIENLETEENWLDMFDENQILSEFAENLNLKAANNQFDKIVDFDDKISEISTILCRKKKPNAILVGPAGTGKTSLVEGLAYKIVNGEAPELIANKVIYSLSLSSMVAGTQYRGQFEERLENFINEVKKYDNIILFIDEIHTLVGAGGTTENSLEASNILKPELARGTISCIGATTINEYNNTIKKDSALDRRFERVVVNEPSKFQMQEILPTIISYYEDFHGVKYSEHFLKNILNFCERYLPNKHYPDKAIDVVDHCGAQAKVSYWNIDPSIKDLQSTIIDKIENNQPYEHLMELMNDKIQEWSENIQAVVPTVCQEHLEAFFAKKENFLCKQNYLNKIFCDLNKEFVGHRKILADLKTEILKSNFLLNKNKSAPDIYCISGKQTTGKTFFCSIFNDLLRKNGANVLTYNGVNFSEIYDNEKILSYQNKNTSLCEKIIIHPNSIIIIDDFHKIHPNTKTLFAQIFKEGKLQMHNGETADFSNCKFFVTSDVNQEKEMGFNFNNQKEISSISKDLTTLFSCELFLQDLSTKDIRRILWQKLCRLKDHLKIKNVELDYNFKFIKLFANEIKNISQFEDLFDEKINKFVVQQIITGSQKIFLEKLPKNP